MTDELKAWEFERGYDRGKEDMQKKIKAAIKEIYGEMGRTGDTSEFYGLDKAVDIFNKHIGEQE